jgi:hypothetical protein
MRPVGSRVISACEALEDGPCGCAELGRRIDMPSPNASKYLQRAVEYGLVTIKKPEAGRGQHSNFGIYTVKPNWRDLVSKKPKLPRVDKEPHQLPRKKTMFSYANSIFNLGA